MHPNVSYNAGQPPPYTPYPEAKLATSIIVINTVGPDPMILTCPSCNSQIVTRTERQPSTKTHVIACILFWFICWPCVCLPYCLDSCNNIDHYCPNCNAYIGGYKN